MILKLGSDVFGPMRVHYRTCGQGDPVLLVHGLMASSDAWRNVEAELGRHYRLIMPDLPGCGQTEMPRRGAFTAENLAIWLGEFQRALDLEGCLAAGSSVGGFLCLLAALQRSNSFSRLVMLHAPGLPLVRFRVLSALLALPGAKTLLAKWIRREGAWAVVRYLAETLRARDLEAFARGLGDRRRRQELFPVPLMLVYAHQDPLVPAEMGRRFHRLLPESSLVWLEAPFRSPERMVALLLGFFQSDGVVAPSPKR